MESTSHNGHGDFKRVVEHHQPNIEKAYHEALKKLNSYPPELRVEWDLLAIAVVMHVHVCHAMRRIFAEVPGATPGKKKSRAFILELDGAPLNIPEVVNLKCKQVDQKLLTKNIPTDAVKAFNTQSPARKRTIQDTLDPSWGPPKTVDSEPPARGNAGYMLDALKTGFDRLCVTYMRDLRSAELVLELSTTATKAEVISLPIAEITEAPAKKSRVRHPRKRKDAETPKKRIKTETPTDDTVDEINLPKQKEE